MHLLTPVLAVLVWLAPLAASADTSTKTVTIQAAAVTKRPIHRGDRFEVELKTRNTTATKQRFELMSCGWVETWRTDDAQLRSEKANCDKNVPSVLELAPGAVDIRSITLTVQPDASLGAHAVRLGFTPPGTKAPIWSNSITVAVIAVTR